MRNTGNESHDGPWQEAVKGHVAKSEEKTVGPTIGSSLLIIILFFAIQGIFALVAVLGATLFGLDTNDYVYLAWAFFTADLVILYILKCRILNGTVAHRAFYGLVRPLLSNRSNILHIGLLLILIGVVDEAYIRLFQLDMQVELKGIFLSLFNGDDAFALTVWLLSVVVLGPIIEEVIFRGYLQTALVEKIGPLLGIFIASAVFAFIHFDAEAFLPLLFSGLAFGYLRHKNESLYPSIILHGLVNGYASISFLYF